jgi:hypothetical protein
MLPWASPSQGVRLRLCTGVRPRSSHALPRPGLATEPPAPRSIDQPQPRLVRQPANQLPHKATLTGFSHRNTPERSSESLSGLLGSPRVALCITANRRRSLDSRTALRKSLGCALRCRASRDARFTRRRPGSPPTRLCGAGPRLAADGCYPLPCVVVLGLSSDRGSPRSPQPSDKVLFSPVRVGPIY